TRPDLDLLGTAMLEQLALLDPPAQLRLEAQHSVDAQHVWDEVVGEHRQPIEVAETGHAGSRQIGGGDLRALEEWDAKAVVCRSVREAFPASQALGERDPRSAGRLDERGEAALMLGRHVPSEVVQR